MKTLNDLEVDLGLEIEIRIWQIFQKINNPDKDYCANFAGYQHEDLTNLARDLSALKGIVTDVEALGRTSPSEEELLQKIFDGLMAHGKLFNTESTGNSRVLQ